MEMQKISAENKKQVMDFIQSHWFSSKMVVRGKLVDMTELEGFVVYEMNEIIGLITYKIIDNECEIISLDSLREKQGIGTLLVEQVIKVFIRKKCKKVKLVTTNDNMNAIRFYQTHGFDMVQIYRNSLEAARKLKPSIPKLGNFGIPMKHEIEFEKLL